jgi:hypothetical protein
MQWRDVIGLVKYWRREPPPPVMLREIAKVAGIKWAAPEAESRAPQEYSTAEEIAAFQRRIDRIQGTGGTA